MECLTEEEERKKEDRRTKKDIDSPQSFEANNKNHMYVDIVPLTFL